MRQIRAALAAQFAASLEKLGDATPDDRKRVAETRERMKRIIAQLAQQAQAAARG